MDSCFFRSEKSIWSEDTTGTVVRGALASGGRCLAPTEGSSHCPRIESPLRYCKKPSKIKALSHFLLGFFFAFYYPCNYRIYAIVTTR